MHFDILMSFHVFAEFAKKKSKRKTVEGKSKKNENRQKNKSLFPFVRF